MLAAWYPLISDCHNQGVLNAELTEGVSGATFGPGILGGCLTNCGRCYWDATTTASILNNDAMTFAFWIYPTDATGTSRTQEIFGNTSTATTNNRHYTIFQYPTCNDLHISWQVEGSSTGSVCQVIWSGVFPSNTWTHCCITYQNPNGKLYINGQLHATFTGNYNNSNFAFKTQALVSWNNRKLCDFRIYTHCLSALEVKQISQALLLHYPMTGGGKTVNNLLKYTAVNATNQALTRFSSLTRTTIDGFDCYQYPSSWGSTQWSSGEIYIGMLANTTYTYSAWIYFTAQASFNFTSLGHFQVINSQSSTPSDPTHEDVPAQRIYEPSTIPANKWTKIRITFTTNSLANSRFQVYPRYALNANVGDLYFRDWKLELGNHPTPWCPNSVDNEYTSMGYGDNTEYDTSGYLHNGTINGSVSYSSDTVRYSVSTEFSKAGYVNVPSFNVDTSAFTLNFWVKMKTATSQHFVLGTFGSWTNNGIGVYRDTNGVNYQCLIRSGAESTYKSFALGLSTGSWYMLTLTYDGTNYKGYLNGILKQNATYGSGGAVSNPVFMVGNSKFNSTPASENEEAFVSDVRFYATALSAEDIQKLYNTSASIANNGVLMSYEFAET